MNKVLFNNARKHSSPDFGVPEFTQDLAEFDNGNEVVLLEEQPDRYKSVLAHSYALSKQLAEGIEPTKAGTYMHMERIYGADIATRTVQKLQEKIDAARVEEEVRKRREASEKALLDAARAAAGTVQPTATD